MAQVMDLMQRRPESNTAMILGHWYGSPEGELLNQLASQERLIPTEGVENQFFDTIKRLVEHPKRQNMDAQVDKLKDRNYADISELERLEARRTLEELRRLDEERQKKPKS